MGNQDVSHLLVKLATETATVFGNDSKNFKFIYGFYLTGVEHPKVIGESLNIVSSVGLEKFVTVNLAYSPEDFIKNEVLIYPSNHAVAMNKTIQSSLNSAGVPYRLRSENV